jgi:hypothetical protein
LTVEELAQAAHRRLNRGALNSLNESLSCPPSNKRQNPDNGRPDLVWSVKFDAVDITQSPTTELIRGLNADPEGQYQSLPPTRVVNRQ